MRFAVKQLFAFLLCISMGTVAIHAERTTEEFSVIFPLNGIEIEPSLANNASQLREAINFLDKVKNDSEATIISVGFFGTASPEGPYEINRNLAEKRLHALENVVRNEVYIPQTLITYNHSYIPWQWLRNEIAASNMDYKTEVLAIIDGPSQMVNFPGDRTIDSRVTALRELHGGKAWDILNKRFFDDMRIASAVIVVEHPDTPVAVIEEPQPVVEEEVVEVVEVIEIEEEPDWYHKMYIKTNIPAWGLLWQNIALEWDLARHWSFAVPVYWSPYNYGKQTLKFRTLAVVPEFRYWPKAENMGFFINAHFGMAYYNYAKGGAYRYQDHDGKTPALGGGLGIGYRFYFCRNHHWSMEVAVGGGAYWLDYDIFENTPSTKYGHLLGRKKRMFYGVDQAAFTISYSFGLRKKSKE